MVWKCPKSSCNHHEISIKITKKNVTATSVFKKVIFHFLQHLKKNNVYFRAQDFYNIYEENVPPNSLTDEDRSRYPSESSNLIWWTNIRGVYGNAIRNKGYTETDKGEIPEIYQQGITDRRSLRTQKRTSKFFKEHKIYDDWELYHVESEAVPISEEKIEEEIEKEVDIEIKEEQLISITTDLDFSKFDEKFEEIPLYFDDSKSIKNQILACLETNKHIIFFGPPGTGKTKLAESICDLVYESNKSNENIHGYIFTTATSDWTTFETIGGYMPSLKEQNNLEFRPGLFLQCFRDFDNNPINKWLIIDEINRADIDKAFGQLFSILSGNKVTLPYLTQDEKEISIEPVKIEDFSEAVKGWHDNIFYVTNKWHLFATMNTYDKASLYEMSYAFMRRFAFVHIGVPKVKTGIINKIIAKASWKVDKSKIDSYISTIEILWGILNKKRKIGPAIIYDILRYLGKYGDSGSGLTYAIIQFILPQFEGLDEDDIIECITDVETQISSIEPEILNNVIKNMLDIDIPKIKPKEETEEQ